MHLFHCVLELFFHLAIPDTKADRVSTFCTSFKSTFKNYLQSAEMIEDTKKYADDIRSMMLESYDKLLHGGEKVEKIIRFYLFKQLPNTIYKESQYEAMRQYIKSSFITCGNLLFDVEYFVLSGSCLLE